MTGHDIDGTAVEEPIDRPAPGMEVVPAGPTAQLAVAPQVEAGELVKRLDLIREAMQTAMTADVDYGVIPGTGGKPTLLKPGAEKLAVLFQLDVQTVTRKEWGPGDHLTVEASVTVFHAPTGIRLGSGEGLCTTREKKYGKRKADRVCPTCGATAIIKGKAEYGGGWLCWKKRDGCNAKFSDGDQRIESQQAGEVDNPDLPDTWNTVVKMAKKRAVIDAVLLATGASALFTQDAEDLGAQAQPEQPQPVTQDTPEPGLTETAYRRIVAAYQAAGAPDEDLRVFLDGLGVPAAPDVAHRVAALTGPQSMEVVTFLEARAIPAGGLTPATPEAA